MRPPGGSPTSSAATTIAGSSGPEGEGVTGASAGGGPAPAEADHTASQHFRTFAIQAVMDALKEDPTFWSAKRVVKEEVLKPQYDVASAKEMLGKVLRASGSAAVLKGIAYERLRELRRQRKQVHRLAGPGFVGSVLPAPPLAPPGGGASSSSSAPRPGAGGLAGGPDGDAGALDVIEWARWRWASLLLRRLTDLSTEQSQPFLRRRRALDDPRGGTGSGGQSGHFHGSDTAETLTRPIVEVDRLHRLLTSELAAYSRDTAAASSAGGGGGGGGGGRRRDAEGGGAGGSSAPSVAAQPSLLSRGLWWGSLGVHLRAESVESLRLRYQDLSPLNDHLGLADMRRSSAEAELAEKRLAEGQALLAEPYVPELQIFARFGVPASLRRQVWALCLSTEASAGAYSLQRLSKSVCDWEWITDDVLRLDVAEFCANDVNYFPFDEMVESLVLALSRDTSVPSSCDAGPPQSPLLTGPPPDSAFPGAGAGAAARTSGEAQTSVPSKPQLVPPFGVVPFRGFSCYACPFAFLADVLDKAFPLFRAFYCRYLSKLHTISSQPGTLLQLCALFESLVFTSAPHVGYHLAQLGPEAAPLKFAFPWIVFGFVGYLRVEQVLQLWDRVVGFGSVQLIAVLAASIFAFRSRLVLSAKTAKDVELIFSDISELQALPLLQAFLFAPELASAAGAAEDGGGGGGTPGVAPGRLPSNGASGYPR